MPYASNDELPARVKDNIPSKTGKDLFREVVNSQLADGRSESVAFASAWAALANAGFEQSDAGKWVKKADPTLSDVHVPSTTRRRRKPKDKERTDKRTLGDDRFTTVQEAQMRSFDLGLGGATHVHPSANGEAQFMPGATHDVYLRRVAARSGTMVNTGEEEDTDMATDTLDERPMLLRTILDAVLDRFDAPRRRRDENDGGRMEEDDNRMDRERLEMRSDQAGEFLKLDDEQRMVWGWASVVTEKGQPVVDTQGDVIAPEELVKAATEFMVDVRVAKAMHEGDQVGEVIHSLPLTYELAKSLGLQTEDEGWIVAMKIHDDAVWERVKAGELSAFSIGGEAVKEPIE